MPQVCPTCRQPVDLDDQALGDALISLSDEARDVWDAIYFAAPHPVMSEGIFSYVYCDHPEGGPSLVTMHKALRAAFAEIADKLKDAPIRIVNVGLRKGWRIEIFSRQRIEDEIHEEFLDDGKPNEVLEAWRRGEITVDDVIRMSIDAQAST